MRLRGDWEDALEEAQRACDWLSLPTSLEGPADAFYQLGELHRLRGDVVAAEEAYRQASRLGRMPEPGLALLWLAVAGPMRRAPRYGERWTETGEDRARRSGLLGAHVDILLALDDAPGARSAAAELREIAIALDASLLHAIADRAEGSVLIAEGEATPPSLPFAVRGRSGRNWTRHTKPLACAS